MVLSLVIIYMVITIAHGRSKVSITSPGLCFLQFFNFVNWKKLSELSVLFTVMSVCSAVGTDADKEF